METNRIDYTTIQQYLEGSLDKEAMHELEKRALDDPFLADAIEGYTHINKPASKQLSLLQTQLEERIAQQQENKNVFNFNWQRLSVAAAASLLFITASILFWFKGQKTEEQIALNPKQVEVSLTPADSIVANDDTSKKESVVSIPSETPKDIVKPKENVQIASSEPEKVSNPNPEVLNIPAKLSEVTAYGTQRKQVGLEVASAPKEETAQIRIRGMASASSKNGVLGRVVSSNGQPIPGAIVKLKNSDKVYTTNSIGVFHFSDSVAGDLVVSQIGFNSKEVNAKPGEYVVITLDEDKNTLSEVVVVDNASTNTNQDEFPQPIIGWDKYKEYLRNNIKSDTNLPAGRVVVTFKVDAANQLSDFKIKKGLNDLRNQEAIKLIKEGPAWKSGKQNEVRVVVRF
ncbi:MAG: carboxypeptidase-like regulatory domain-containing protein [Sphingobacteriaceae bacterium]